MFLNLLTCISLAMGATVKPRAEAVASMQVRSPLRHIGSAHSGVRLISDFSNVYYSINVPIIRPLVRLIGSAQGLGVANK